MRALSLLAGPRGRQGERSDKIRGPRFGFTVTRKVGNAVERNRIRRRLKEVVRLRAGLHANAKSDYVLIGRRQALYEEFAEICSQFDNAMHSVNRRLSRQGGSGRNGGEPVGDPARKGGIVRKAD